MLRKMREIKMAENSVIMNSIIPIKTGKKSFWDIF